MGSFQIDNISKVWMFLYIWRVSVWRRQYSACVWGVGVVVVERSEALTNQTWVEIIISTPDRLMSGWCTRCAWPCRLWPRSEFGVRWLVDRGFTKNQASQSEREREAGDHEPSSCLGDSKLCLQGRHTLFWWAPDFGLDFLYVRISGKLVTSGLELNVIINGWIPVEKDFVWYYTSLLGSWITPSRLRHQRLWILRRPASHRPLAAP